MMKIARRILLIISMLLFGWLFFGCKSHDPKDLVLGKWKVTSLNDFPFDYDTKKFKFTNDAIIEFKENSVIKFSENQIFFHENYKISQNILTLYNNKWKYDYEFYRTKDKLLLISHHRANEKIDFTISPEDIEKNQLMKKGGNPIFFQKVE